MTNITESVGVNFSNAREITHCLSLFVPSLSFSGELSMIASLHSRMTGIYKLDMHEW